MKKLLLAAFALLGVAASAQAQSVSCLNDVCTIGVTLKTPGLTGLVYGNGSGGNVSAFTTLPTSAFPALTGDVTTSAGSLATTVSKIGGKAVSLDGAFTMSGAFSFTGTLTGATALTFPTSGTVTALGNSTTGTAGSIVLSISPTFTSALNGTVTFSSDQNIAGGAQQILVKGASNANQQILIGYHTGSNYANFQAVLQGTGYKPTFISPSGGGAGVGVTALVGSDLFTVGGQVGATIFRSGSATLVTTSTALTNGAAANTATLTNAPTAGNPTKWVPINDNGTTRYIPAW